MITTLRRWLTCHWASSRIQRYLDTDPSAPLLPGELRRLRSHLEVCAYCTGRVEIYRRLHGELRQWGGTPSSEQVDRVRNAAERLIIRDQD